MVKAGDPAGALVSKLTRQGFDSIVLPRALIRGQSTTLEDKVIDHQIRQFISFLDGGEIDASYLAMITAWSLRLFTMRDCCKALGILV